MSDITSGLRQVTGWPITVAALGVLLVWTWRNPQLKLFERFQAYKKHAGRIGSYLVAATSFTFFTAASLDAGPPQWIAQRSVTGALERLHIARREVLAAHHVVDTLNRLPQEDRDSLAREIRNLQTPAEAQQLAIAFSARMPGIDDSDEIVPGSVAGTGPDRAPPDNEAGPSRPTAPRRPPGGGSSPSLPGEQLEREAKAIGLDPKSDASFPVRAASTAWADEAELRQKKVKAIAVDAIKALVGATLPNVDPLLDRFAKAMVESVAKTLSNSILEDATLFAAAERRAQQPKDGYAVLTPPSIPEDRIRSADRLLKPPTFDLGAGLPILPPIAHTPYGAAANLSSGARKPDPDVAPFARPHPALGQRLDPCWKCCIGAVCRDIGCKSYAQAAIECPTRWR